MKLFKQPNRWSCLPTSFAMILEMTPSNFIEYFNHDGSEIVRPDLNPPYCYKAFHIMECIYLMHEFGYSVTPFDAMPVSSPANIDVWSEDIATSKLKTIMYNTVGVITGYTFQNRAHAVGWYNNQIYDPAREMIVSIEEIRIETFWLVNQIKDKK